VGNIEKAKKYGLAAFEKYNSIPALRAIIQFVIPAIAPLDTMMSGYAGKYVERKFQETFEHLELRVSKVENLLPFEKNDATLDLFLVWTEGVIKSRTEDKRKRFANIIASRMIHNEETDEAIDAVKLLNQCEDIHIEILKIGMNTPSCSEWDGSKVFAVMEEESLNEKIPNVCELLAAKYQKHHIIASCCQLVGFGLLYDDGVGRLAPAAMTHFVLTDTGKWFLDWISD
jgi:hypothetical protein